jgi:hypothetical protein
VSDIVSNQYGFIGNLKRPFDVITMLASKSIPDSGIAGYFFYETINGYNFRSIDKLIVDGKEAPKAEYYHQEDQDYKKSTDDRILSYSVTRNNDLLEKLRLGAYASFFAQYNPNTARFTKVQEGKFSIEDFADKATFLGDPPELPQAIGGGFENIPSRIVSSIIDVGVMEKEVNKTPVNDASEGKDYQRTSMFRYQYLFMQTLNKELCHHFDGTQSLTSMKLLRDTFGD